MKKQLKLYGEHAVRMWISQLQYLSNQVSLFLQKYIMQLFKSLLIHNLRATKLSTASDLMGTRF